MKIFFLAASFFLGLFSGVEVWGDDFSPQGSYRIEFSPGQAQDLVIAAIDASQSQIRAALYEFTNKKILSALKRAVARGVDVRILADPEAMQSIGNKFELLVASGARVYPVDGFKTFHHKFAVIDQVGVVFGSYNWTEAATKQNAEDVVWVQDRGFGARFEAEWERLLGGLR